MTNKYNRDLEDGEILDEDHSSSFTSNNKDKQTKCSRNKTKEEKISSKKKKHPRSRSVETKFNKYLVKKCADFFTKDEYNKFVGILTDLVCDKALENPDFDPRIVSVARSDKYRNVIKIQCENLETFNWIETLDFSSLLKIDVVKCTGSNVDRAALDLIQVDVVIPIVPGSRIRKKEEIIPIFKGTNKNDCFRFDEWKMIVYEHNSDYLNISFDVSGEIAGILRKNSILSFGPSQVQLTVH